MDVVLISSALGVDMLWIQVDNWTADIRVLIFWQLTVIIGLRAFGEGGTKGPVAELVGIRGGVVSGVMNLESSDVEASDRRPRHENHYHEI